MVNTAETVREFLKLYWNTISTQVGAAINFVDLTDSQLRALFTQAINAASQAQLSALAAAAIALGQSTGRPAVRPTLLLDFVNSRAVDPRLVCTRSSIATYYDAKGVLRTAVANQPRLDHDPVTGKCLGLLAEESRTNLFSYSNTYTDASWTKSNLALEAASTLGPDGLMSATKMTITANGSNPFFNKSVSSTSGTAYTRYIIAKAGTNNTVIFEVTSASWGGSSFTTRFNLETGVISGTTANAFMRHLGNGWYICGRTDTAATTTVGNTIYVGTVYGPATEAGTFVYVWGSQFEAGTSRSSFIPTMAGAVTRAADQYSITGTDFSSWYNAEEWSMYSEFSYSSVPVTGGGPVSHSVYSFTIADGTAYISGGRRFSGTMLLAGTGYTTTQEAGSINVMGQIHRAIQHYKAGSTGGGINGEGVADANNTANFTPNRLLLWRHTGATTILGLGHIRCLAYYPKRLSNPEGLALTAQVNLVGKEAEKAPTVGDLGSAAFASIEGLLMRANRQEFTPEGTGASRTVTIRRPYDFTFALVDATGATVTAQPPASCTRDTDYSLTFNAPAGRILTYSITPLFTS
ncbi:hypothetical protein GCM10027275_50490 [Rhabdobacter roseus]|uniref:Uncharacterized protein n=1 Tax=Rhabdobacter roseus TaxID=1655419 RepID=A0A840TZQ8_9BACT|nr:hypothetical protein [Rhabdobacter roseus]MBB5287122.1 hypothetical protein [Rhabdobacter roseus]